MKISVVFTGGTIGSSLCERIISPDDAPKYELLKNLPKDVEVECFTPYITLSEQLNGVYISKLIQCVENCLKGDVDGVVVTHGTDTLQYSAAALALAFGKSPVPVVLVSSDYVLSDSRANGQDNFDFAVRFIREKIGGVFVSYRNRGCLPEIYPAETLLDHAVFSDRVVSLKGAVGYFQDDRFVKCSLKYSKDNFGAFALNESSPVLRLRVCPGMRLPNSIGYRAVLLEGYHSGTLPTESPQLIDFCRKCTAPIYLAGMSPGNRYESTAAYDSLKIRVLEELTPIYAYMKLWMMLENNIPLP